MDPSKLVASSSTWEHYSAGGTDSAASSSVSKANLPIPSENVDQPPPPPPQSDLVPPPQVGLLPSPQIGPLPLPPAITVSGPQDVAKDPSGSALEEMFDGGDELNSSVGVLPKPKKKVLPDDEESDDSDCVITGQKEPVRAPVSSSKGPARAPASSSKPPKSSSKSPKSPPKIDRTREECTMRMELARKHLKSGELGKQTEESEVWAIWTDHVNAEVKFVWKRICGKCWDDWSARLIADPMESPVDMVLRSSALNDDDLFCLYKVRYKEFTCLRCYDVHAKCVWLTDSEEPEEEKKPEVATPGKTRAAKLKERKKKGGKEKRSRSDDSLRNFVVSDSDFSPPPPNKRVKVPKKGEPGSSRYMDKAEKEGSVPGNLCAAKGMAELVAQVEDHSLRSKKILLKLSGLGCGACDHE